jgi:hypothetical protein
LAGDIHRVSTSAGAFDGDVVDSDDATGEEAGACAWTPTTAVATTARRMAAASADAGAMVLRLFGLSFQIYRRPGRGMLRACHRG